MMFVNIPPIMHPNTFENTKVDMKNKDCVDAIYFLSQLLFIYTLTLVIRTINPNPCNICINNKAIEEVKIAHKIQRIPVIIPENIRIFFILYLSNTLEEYNKKGISAKVDMAHIIP